MEIIEKNSLTEYKVEELHKLYKMSINNISKLPSFGINNSTYKTQDNNQTTPLIENENASNDIYRNFRFNNLYSFNKYKNGMRNIPNNNVNLEIFKRENTLSQKYLESLKLDREAKVSVFTTTDENKINSNRINMLLSVPNFRNSNIINATISSYTNTNSVIQYFLSGKNIINNVEYDIYLEFENEENFFEYLISPKLAEDILFIKVYINNDKNINNNNKICSQCK